LNVSPILTHNYGVDDFETGFQTMRSGQSGKIVLNWS
ncbi:MAG TPA: L-threonine 3-dehydrogenase, partial [Gammaproteobacteria bacterium]|nr:L-threonine 3-dehydrogenase [Gammaproteobacteria bacterium]